MPKIGATCKHMEYMMLVGYRGESVARLRSCLTVRLPKENQMRITIHETYEYEVEADSANEAIELFHEYMEGGEDAELVTGVSFNQNYLHTYNENMEEL